VPSLQKCRGQRALVNAISKVSKIPKQSIRPYWTGTSLQLRLMPGVFSNANDFDLFFMIFPA